MRTINMMTIMKTRKSSLIMAFIVAMAVAPCFSVPAADAPEVK